MAMRIVVLGGGTAGTTVANRLARALRSEIRRGAVEVTVVTDRDRHWYQPGYLFVVFNERPLEDFVRSERALLLPDVGMVVDAITRIDLEHKQLISPHRHYPYDVLVIATGSYPDFQSVPGLAEVTYNFYTPEGAERLRDRLTTWTGGRILIVQDVPHKCPAAPVEVTLMLDDYFRRRRLRDRVEIVYTYPIGRVHAAEPIADWAKKQFDARGIRYETFFNMEAVDPKRQVVLTMDGSEHPFDLLISIPAHKGAGVILNSGIGDESGFIPTDRHTLKMIGQDDVYVLGDATNLPISKAGSTAHYQAEVLVKNLVDRVRGLPETHLYNGKVACFLENSLGDASFITFDYDRPPRPAATSQLLHWFKGMYNDLYWLTARGLM